MTVGTLLGFVAGLALLVAGGDLLVRGASALAERLGVPHLVVGLTVVAFGTSAPELAVSLGAALSGGGAADLALGNVVGSNIFNVLFILGLVAAISPAVVAVRLVRLEVPLMIASALVLLALAWDGSLVRLDGTLLFAGLVAYMAYTVREVVRERPAAGAPETGAGSSRRGVLPQLLYLAGGLILLVAGARYLVDSAVATARAFGISEVVVGLTIVAAGTSLPEVATSAVAAVRGERDIAVGNIVGSNIFNVLAVAGLAAVFAPAGVSAPSSLIAFDLPLMIAVSVACLPIFFTGYRIERWEGVLFLGYYAAYMAYVLLAAAEHDALPLFGRTMLLFVVPVTAVTVAVTVARELRGRA